MTHLINSAFDRQAMQRVCGWLDTACLVLIVVLPCLMFAHWHFADAGILAVHANMFPQSIQTPLKDWQRWGGALLTCLPLGLMLRGLWEARLCFKQFAMGHVFTTQAVQRLRSFAGWVVASSVVSILIGPLVSIVLTYGNAPGNRHIAIGVGTDDALSLLFAAVVWVMAAVIAQGQDLAEENSSFV
jgi:Protein of unknown function (DUF2975)